VQVIVQKIVVLGTGGTIAGTAASASASVDYAAAQLAIGDVIGALPLPQNIEVVTEQVAQVDSKDMTLDAWHLLASRCADWGARADVAGIVVTHGTDTLEETAFFLHAVLPSAKPVALTCAMRPATALQADGPQNLVDALTVAASGHAAGVVVVCGGTIHSPVAVRKVHPYRLDAFSSGEAGPLGVVEEGRLRMFKPWPQDGGEYGAALQALEAGQQWPRVEIVTSHVGADARLVDALTGQGIDGMVVAGTGNGTVHSALEAGLLRAAAAGISVVRSSRCMDGAVLPREADLLEGSGALTPVKARIAMMLQLLTARVSG